MPEALQTPPDSIVRLVKLSEEVRIAKMKLSGFKDPFLADFVPGAARVATEVSDLLDRLFKECQG